VRTNTNYLLYAGRCYYIISKLQQLILHAQNVADVNKHTAGHTYAVSMPNDMYGMQIQMVYTPMPLLVFCYIYGTLDYKIKLATIKS
jgi:hypothetical protein